MENAPIVLFVYNRPLHLVQTVEALKKNYLSEESILYIYSDKEKLEKDENEVQKVRSYCKSITGFKSVKLIERDHNYGLAKSIISGVTEIINTYGKVIVLEDDLVTSKYFLKFMNDGLNYYENNDKVISIHGYLYPIKGRSPDTFFLRGADCWGWATWERGWSLFEKDGSKLLKDIKGKKLRKKFTRNYSYPYLKMLKDQIKGKNDSWAIRWYASALLKNKLTLYPGMSLVEHIGNDGSGTNVKTLSKYLKAEISKKPIKVEQIDLHENIIVLREIEKFNRKLVFNLLVNYIKNLVH